MKSKLLKYILLLSKVLGVVISLASTNALAQSGSDSLVMQKMKLEKSIYERLNNIVKQIVPEDKYVLNVTVRLKSIQTESVKLKKQLPGLKGDVPTLSKLWVWGPPQQRKELVYFDNQIRGVLVDLFIETSIGKQTQEKVKSLVTLVAKSTMSYPVQLSVNSREWGLGQQNSINDADKKNSIKDTNKKIDKLMSLKDWLLELKTPVGVVASALILFILGIIFIFQYGRVESNKMEITKASSLEDDSAVLASEVAFDTNSIGSDNDTVESVPNTDDLKVLPGYKQFYGLSQEEPEVAAYLLKTWVNSENKSASEALVLVAQILSQQELQKLTLLLTEKDRKRWRELLFKTEINSKSYRDVGSFLNKEVIGHLMVPPIKLDQAMVDLLAEVTPDEVVDCINADSSLASVFLNLLPAHKVARVFMRVDLNHLGSITEEGVKYSKASFSEKKEKLISTLQSVRSQNSTIKTPFEEMLPELINQVGPHREGPLFKTLLATGNKIQVIETGRKIFPAELIYELPNEILKAALDMIPLAKRAELIAGMPGDKRDLTLDVLNEYRKLKEILDIEIDEILESDFRRKLADKNYEMNWVSYIKTIRGMVAFNQEYSDTVVEILNGWFDRLAKGVVSGDRHVG